MQQLYLTDLDHTFLTTQQTITPYSKKIWNQLSQKTLLSVATARSFAKIEEFLEGMNLNAPLILLDGAMMVSVEKEIIDIHPLEIDLVNAIIHESKKFEMEPFLLSLEERRTLREVFSIPHKLNPYQSHLIDWKYKSDPRLRQTHHIQGLNDTLKVVYMGEEQPLKQLAEHLKQTFGDNIEAKLSPEHYTGCWFLTILHPLGDKAHALKKLSEYLNISLEEVTVFGDNINDIEMFKLAGTSVAVNNALDRVKAEASIVLPHTNDEDAVARYLERIKL